MLEISEDELLPISEFRMAWRFEQHTDKSRLWCLSESGVKRIARPWLEAWAMLVDDYWRPLPEVDTVDGSDDAIVLRWLRSLNLGSERIIVHWLAGGHADAVVTDVDFFIFNWSDFCHPSSDDVVIVPVTLAWALAYWHEDRLFFKQLDAR